MQATWGDESKNLIQQANLSDYLPKRWLEKCAVEKWREILSKSCQELAGIILLLSFTSLVLTGKSAVEAKDLYFTHASNWPFFGTTIFFVKQTLSLNLPKELWIGINTTGIHLFQINNKVGAVVTCVLIILKTPLVSFTYQQIMNWGPSNDSFFFMTGDLMQPQKFVFNTKQVLLELLLH